MSNCVPKIQEINYKEENWWKNFFEKDLANFYSSLKGFDIAREELINSLNDDLGKILANDIKRNIALSIIFGGMNDDCIDKDVIDDKCFPPNSIAYIYKNLIGIGLNKENLNKFIKKVKYTMLFKNIDQINNEYSVYISAGNGLKFDLTNTELNQKFLKIVKSILNNIELIYNKIGMSIKLPEPKQYEIKNADDLIKYLTETLDNGAKLLPFYNPFSFFIQSLRSVPKPYLKIMYCEDILSDNVKNLMKKYGIELTTLLTPDLGENIDEEFAIIGHKENSVGDLILKYVVFDLYVLLNLFLSNPIGIKVVDEYGIYLENYKNYLQEFFNYIGSNNTINYKYNNYNTFKLDNLEIMGFTLEVDTGKIQIHGHDYDYLDFISKISPPLFVGLAWISDTGNVWKNSNPNTKRATLNYIG